MYPTKLYAQHLIFNTGHITTDQDNDFPNPSLSMSLLQIQYMGNLKNGSLDY